MATDKESLIIRLRAACVGHPCATIAWPHRILHEAADELTAANARIAELEALRAQVVALKEAGVPTLLWCPRCGQQHIDKGLWATVPHRTHYCNFCCTEWRPFEVATYGCSVEDIKRRVTTLETHKPIA